MRAGASQPLPACRNLSQPVVASHSLSQPLCLSQVFEMTSDVNNHITKAQIDVDFAVAATSVTQHAVVVTSFADMGYELLVDVEGLLHFCSCCHLCHLNCSPSTTAAHAQLIHLC